ncbi:glycoside hydrolase family 43 [Beutenbergia cavernae DSM 12333]|uniref:Glycoside hydrolase family 43 n=1 Tax=Beutenbergia cavernae (strain ATCC BAA-8 / DSM 12333 / CCUG 43141 / JCM 11478 / NBRC 16432 / NCIMB 13614 / HKI 0122) TaxID=471853 RepID=C5C1C5_BEUC1|nr:glycoside hydrolase family 43 protein [Beutenbergia cavernae]ACQ81535.1 glycoside hydrolase family 43 [Beutenbergia cavernae DSM 12333]
MPSIDAPLTRRVMLGGTAAAAGALALGPAAAHAGGGRPGHPPTYVDATVHDPDVVRTGGRYYVFGSHAAAASTEDLFAWDQIAYDGVTPENPLFDDVTVELAEVLEWARTTTLWAPDVSRLPDGRFYYYYCACEGTSPRSGLGVAVADEVTGPYRDLGIILRSGQDDGTSEEPGEAYDPWVHPNVIDADVFADDDGTWWMVYGSFSGGILLLELDPATAKPVPGQGYGRHLMGGNHARIEGPAIMYHPGTRYYYLFVTFGGLDAAGGYNIRVSRARTPEGPWFDISGTDMSTVKADPDLPLFDDVTIAPHGTKIAGNVRFRTPDGAPGTGYVSPGGCSPWYDEESGDAFLAFHTRFPGTGEIHNVRVHRLAMTRSGWPVVLPFRYAGERLGGLGRHDVAGDYEVVTMAKPIGPEIAESRPVTLTRNGRVTGEHTGRWRLTGRSHVVLELDDVTYSGVAATQWDPDLEAWSVTFSAVSDAGTSVWGARR